jgi:hypothetical protein
LSETLDLVGEATYLVGCCMRDALERAESSRRWFTL